MPVGQQDQRGVPVAVPAEAPSAGHELVQLGRGCSRVRRSVFLTRMTVRCGIARLLGPDGHVGPVARLEDASGDVRLLLRGAPLQGGEDRCRPCRPRRRCRGSRPNRSRAARKVPNRSHVSITSAKPTLPCTGQVRVAPDGGRRVTSRWRRPKRGICPSPWDSPKAATVGSFPSRSSLLTLAQRYSFPPSRVPSPTGAVTRTYETVGERDLRQRLRRA